ncbi:MAG: hypothetical protein IJ368_07695 [Oscillospiraceae bacterium]|nr:hypothetical protein [Oscillospiraceae bacterium]
MITAGKETAAETARAVTLCLTVMIPSLYAFTVVSKLLISTDTYKLLGKPFSLFTRYVMRMPSEFFPIFVISQLAGYPIGAALINELRSQDKISSQAASDMLCFCISPGPAYIMTASLAAAPDCPQIWTAVFLSLTGANLAGVLITSFFREIPPPSESKCNIKFNADIFTSSVKSGAESMMMICSMIVFMAAVLGIFGKYGILRLITQAVTAVCGMEAVEIYPFVRSFFEISSITSVIGDATVTIPITTAMLSFGGLCVHLQITAVCKDFSPVKGLLMRVPAAVLSCFICSQLIPEMYTVSIISANADISNDPIFAVNNPPILSIILLIMTILILSQKTIEKKRVMCYNNK